MSETEDLHDSAQKNKMLKKWLKKYTKTVLSIPEDSPNRPVRDSSVRMFREMVQEMESERIPVPLNALIPWGEMLKQVYETHASKFLTLTGVIASTKDLIGPGSVGAMATPAPLPSRDDLDKLSGIENLYISTSDRIVPPEKLMSIADMVEKLVIAGVEVQERWWLQCVTAMTGILIQQQPPSPPPLPADEPYIDMAKAAQVIGHQREWFEKHHKDGTGPKYYHPGKKIMFKASEVRDWFEKRFGKTPPGLKS